MFICSSLYDADSPDIGFGSKDCNEYGHDELAARRDLIYLLFEQGPAPIVHIARMSLRNTFYCLHNQIIILEPLFAF